MTLKRESRESWGAVPPRARRYDVGWEGVVIHYPGADVKFRDMSHSTHQRFMRDWQRMHLNRGSNDYEYGSVICPCGIWMEARTEWDKPGVRCGSNGTAQANYRYTSVQLMVGTREGITEQEKQWLGEAVAWLRSKGWGNKVLGHRDTFPTACPGDSIYRAIPDIERYANNPEDDMPITDDEMNRIADKVVTKLMATPMEDTGYDKGHDMRDTSYRYLLSRIAGRSAKAQQFSKKAADQTVT